MVSVQGFFYGLCSVLRPDHTNALQENDTAKSASDAAMRVLPSQAPDQSPVQTNHRVISGPFNESLLLLARRTKDHEWRVTLDGLNIAFCSWFMEKMKLQGTFICARDIHAYVDAIPSLDPKELFRKKLARQLHLQLQLGKLSTEKYKEQLDSLESFITTLLCLDSANAFVHDLKEWLINIGVSENEEVLHTKATELASDLFLVKYPEDYLASLHQLKQDVKLISDLLFNLSFNDPDPKQRVLAILYRLRIALRQRAYKLACSDEHNPFVSLLHKLSIASLTNPQVANCWYLLGNAIIENAFANENAKPAPLGTLVETSRNHAIKEGGVPEDDKQPQAPLLESLVFMIQQITALIPVGLALSNFFEFYRAKSDPAYKDHRGFYENNPGKLYEEILGNVNSCVLITSSPAVGSDVMPEFSALLQSIENCNIQDLACPFERVAYSNLQDKKGGKEEQQTKALMLLEDFYPLSIKCITVHQGSYKNQNKNKPFTAAQKELKLEELFADDNFMLVHKEKGSGYYFHPKDKERWKKASSKIVELAYDFIVKGNQKATDEEKYIAFSELVNLGIIRHHEKIVANTLEHKNKMASIRSCGPACDRSVKVNMAMMSASRRKIMTERDVAAFGAGRPILAKGRVMTEERAITELGSLYKVITSNTVRCFFDGIDCIDRNGDMPFDKKSVRRQLKLSPRFGNWE